MNFLPKLYLAQFLSWILDKYRKRTTSCSKYKYVENIHQKFYSTKLFTENFGAWKYCMEILVYENFFLIPLFKSFEFPVKKSWSRISGKITGNMCPWIILWLFSDNYRVRNTLVGRFYGHIFAGSLDKILCKTLQFPESDKLLQSQPKLNKSISSQNIFTPLCQKIEPYC